MYSSAEHIRLNTAALRTAAVEVHWLPDMQLRLSQPGKAAFSVGIGGAVDPCTFRQLITNWVQASADPTLMEPFDLSQPLRVDRSVDRGDVDTETGLVVTTFDIHHTVVAFSSVVSEPSTSETAQPESCEIDGIIVTTALDAELGVSLTHASHHTADWCESAHVFQVMCELRNAQSVDAIEAHLAEAAMQPPTPDRSIDRLDLGQFWQ